MENQELKKLLLQIDKCKKCIQLNEHIKFPSSSHGNANSGIMLVSEGAFLPSIQAGRYFTRSFLRQAVPDLEKYCYLTDVIKCHTGGCGKGSICAKNCLPFLYEEIKTIKPKVILAVGKLPFTVLTGYKGNVLDKHGVRNIYFYQNIEIVYLIHPSRANQLFPIEPRVENYKNSLNKLFHALAG